MYHNYDSMKDEIFNVGLTAANISKKELCETIQRQLPDFVFTEEPIGKDPDQRNYYVSNKKIEKKGFKAKIKIESGIDELIKVFSNTKENFINNY